MAPELAAGDILSGVRREVERNAIRARNGIKYVAGAEWAPIGPTPSDTVWHEGKVHLRRYRRETPARLHPPVLLFLGLVSRSYIFDLWQGNSYVQRLMDAGFDAFVLDWDVPDAQDAANTMETYVEGFLPRAIRAVMKETGADGVNLMGYCMGGNLALLGLAAQPGGDADEIRVGDLLVVPGVDLLIAGHARAVEQVERLARGHLLVGIEDVNFADDAGALKGKRRVATDPSAAADD